MQMTVGPGCPVHSGHSSPTAHATVDREVTYDDFIQREVARVRDWLNPFAEGTGHDAGPAKLSLLFNLWGF
jgi:hypothetical protein